MKTKILLFISIALVILTSCMKDDLEVGDSIFFNDIYFEFASSELSQVSHPLLDRIADVIKDYTYTKIEISAHTDNKGSDSINLALSEDRAKSVMLYLISKDIDPDRMISQGYGKTKPIASNDTDEGRALNRRVEFTIVE